MGHGEWGMGDGALGMGHWAKRSGGIGHWALGIGLRRSLGKPGMGHWLAQAKQVIGHWERVICNWEFVIALSLTLRTAILCLCVKSLFDSKLK
jgi:hypothetical protein